MVAIIRSGAERAVRISLAITFVLAVAKVGVWASTGSIAVLSQALDSVLDIVALILAYLGVRIATKPADEEHHYGHGKAENLTAFAQTLVLGIVVTGVVVEATRNLVGSPSEVATPWYAFALVATSGLVDAYRVRMLTAALKSEPSDALKAGLLNIAIDIATAAVVLVSLLLVRAGFDKADAIGGLLVAVTVGVAALRLGKHSVDVLMDRAEAPVDEIASAAAAAPGVGEARRVRVRKSGHQLFADVTVTAGRTSSLERAHDIAEGVEREIERIAPGTDVVVHVEPVSVTTELVERVQAAASRTDGVSEVHNVLVHEFVEEGRVKLHATLHAKADAGVSVGEAHDLSDRIEEAVRAEIGPHVRVDTHIEPLKSTSPGRDITPERPELVEAVRRAAAEESSVLDCHEVLVTDTDGALSVTAHVRGRSDLRLSLLHEASERIENGLRAGHPEIANVLIHFEPA